MILTCPSCGTRYHADSTRFRAPGMNVRCAKCGHVWFHALVAEAEAPPSVVEAPEPVRVPEPEPEIARAPEPAPEPAPALVPEPAPTPIAEPVAEVADPA